MTSRHRFLVASAAGTALLVLAVVVVALTAYAVIPSPDGVIHGCYKRSGGTLRVVDTSIGTCLSNEIPFSWNQAGQPGAPGAPGISGYEIVTESETFSGLGLFGSFEVVCPEGKSVLGGGAGVAFQDGTISSGMRVVRSLPLSDGTGWRATFDINLTQNGTFLTTVYAICAFVEA